MFFADTDMLVFFCWHCIPTKFNHLLFYWATACIFIEFTLTLLFFPDQCTMASLCLLSLSGSIARVIDGWFFALPPADLRFRFCSVASCIFLFRDGSANSVSSWSPASKLICWCSLANNDLLNTLPSTVNWQRKKPQERSNNTYFVNVVIFVVSSTAPRCAFCQHCRKWDRLTSSVCRYVVALVEAHG